MPSTEQLLITLPVEVVHHMRERMAAGGFTSSSEYIEHIMVESLLPPPPSEADTIAWMNTEGARRIEALRANPASGLTLDEAFAGLIDEDEDIEPEKDE